MLSISHALVLTDKPGKPDPPEISKIKQKAVTLQWKPPASDGGSDIFNYVVEYRSEGSFRWTRSTEDNVPTTSYIVKGLKEEDNYEFRISAENKAGVGPPSDPSASIRPKSPVRKYSKDARY